MADSSNALAKPAVDQEGDLSIAIPDKLDPTRGGAKFWVSSVPETQLDKAKLVNTISGELPKLSTVINTTILVTDIGRQLVELTDKKTGEVFPGVRTLLFCADGKVFSTVSGPVGQTLGLIFVTWGKPPWKPPLPLIVKQLELEGGKRMYQIEIDTSKLAVTDGRKK